MGWIVVILIIVIVLVIWISQRKQPAQRSSSQATVTEKPRRAASRQSKTRELLQMGYVGKVRLTMKYETGNPLPGDPAIKVRDVDIYGLGSKYFDAYCHYRSALRTFKISRVLWVRLSGQRYQIPASYVPSGWVTHGWGELNDIETEESVGQVTPNVPPSPTAKHVEHGYKQERQWLSREATKPGRSDEVTRTYVRHNWQKLFEESIKTPFPDEWSPALPYLYEANKLEKEGADQQRVQEMLEKARQADSDATSFYMGRWSIIKKVRSESHQNREQPR